MSHYLRKYFILIFFTICPFVFGADNTNAPNGEVPQSQSLPPVPSAQNSSGVQNANSNDLSTQKITPPITSDEQPSNPKDLSLTQEQADEAQRLQEASSTGVREFHEVLDELLLEFSYDVRNAVFAKLKNISVRKVFVSDSLPQSYKNYVKLLTTERIINNCNLKVINCLSCYTNSTKLEDGKLHITSPANNIDQLKHIAGELGIENFMDIILVYHSTHMVLALEVYKSGTNELLWTKSYNSETIRSRFQKLAVDYKQVVKGRDSDEYKPEYRILIGFGGAAIPNIGGTSKNSMMFNLQVRSSERFDNRKSDFGLLLSTYLGMSSILKSYPESPTDIKTTTKTTKKKIVSDYEEAPTPQPFTSLIGLYGLYEHNFVGSVESFNLIRHGIQIGLGGLITSGYFSASARVGWDLFFGKRFAGSFGYVYLAPSTVTVNNEDINTVGGSGGDLVMSYVF